MRLTGPQGLPPRRSVVVGVAVLASLTGLAGCSAQQAPGAAAVTADGDVVASVAQVEDLTAELVPLTQNTGPDGVAREVVRVLVIADAVRDVAAANGAIVSTDTVRGSVRDQTGIELSEAAAEVLAVNAMASQLFQGAQAQELSDRLADLDVTVNPRYGDLSSVQGQPVVQAGTLPWVRSAAGGSIADPAP